MCASGFNQALFLIRLRCENARTAGKRARFDLSRIKFYLRLILSRLMLTSLQCALGARAHKVACILCSSLALRNVHCRAMHSFYCAPKAEDEDWHFIRGGIHFIRMSFKAKSAPHRKAQSS